MSRTRRARMRLLAAAALLASTVPAGPALAPTSGAAHHHVSRPRLPVPTVGDDTAAGTVAAVTPEGPAAATCVASHYGQAHRGRPTASGVPFDPDAMTAAAWEYPFGTRLQVIHDGRTVVVEVNDRGPARRLRRCIDLSAAAFARLADLEVGLIDVTVQEVTS